MLAAFSAALGVATLVAATDPTSTHGASCAVESRSASIVDASPPEYPDPARPEALTGQTIVRVTLAENGRLTSAAVEKTSGSPVLDFAAVRAAKAMTFAPEIAACRSVAGTYAVEINFQP
jgi:protein TonB